jgi:cyclopropane-fatty-acyl-phospholipid synthase
LLRKGDAAARWNDIRRQKFLTGSPWSRTGGVAYASFSGPNDAREVTMTKNRRAEEAVRALLSRADILVGGHRPWDIRVLNPEFYSRALDGGSLAAGDAYVDGWWETGRLDQFFHRIFMSDLHERMAEDWRVRFDLLVARFSRRPDTVRGRPAAEARADAGNDVFQAMLGKRMTYTCAYWDGARDLDEAEEAKLEMICRKLELRPGMTVLEYGCGWGAFAKYAAERYGVGVLGVNVSEEQVSLGRQLCRGLPVELLVKDYREIGGRFDRVVSLGVMERLSADNYRTFMENSARRLKDDGIALVHSVVRNETAQRRDPWLDRALSPDGAAPSLRQLTAAAEGLFVVEDCHNIGPQFDPTLLAWHENLSRGWRGLKEKYGERFYRGMKYRLLSSAGSFRSRRSQVFQLVLTKPGRVQPRCRVDARVAV